jgi:hypothetical protein
VLLLLGCGAQVSSGGSAGPSPRTSPSALSSGTTAPPTKPPSSFVLPPLSPWPTASPGQFSAQVIWQGDSLVVTAFGSSMCRPEARSAVAAGKHIIVVNFVPRARNVACTDDFAPHRSRLSAPSGGIDLNGAVYAAFNLDGAAHQLIPVQLRHPQFS